MSKSVLIGNNKLFNSGWCLPYLCAPCCTIKSPRLLLITVFYFILDCWNRTSTTNVPVFYFVYGPITLLVVIIQLSYLLIPHFINVAVGDSARHVIIQHVLHRLNLFQVNCGDTLPPPILYRLFCKVT
ncbi:unnamed protein product [Calicophoron daubneyi]|uniref:Uncharacterized protein n=1 Tax=Calicophoron daubneyi TaxID=300641 RepID=A0AAV2TVU3_CALDB